VTDSEPAGTTLHGDEPESTPLIEVWIDFGSGLRLDVHHDSGDVPLLELITGRAKLIFGVEAGNPQAVSLEHVALAEEFAASACTLRDELRALVAAR
jgi:hypothetical protein